MSVTLTAKGIQPTLVFTVNPGVGGFTMHTGFVLVVVPQGLVDDNITL